MATTKHVNVKDLKLDLKNFRALPQKSESAEVHAIISIKPDWFWALAESLVDSGYLPTENIIVIKSGKNDQQLIVKEGNRRIAAMKLLHGYTSRDGILIPSTIEAKMQAVTEEWKNENAKVPCAIYEASDAEQVDQIVALVHGKDNQAGRAPWTSVARARHNRQMNNVSEPGLDLLEQYLKDGKNLTPHEVEKWAGEYNLTVLNEAMQRIAPRLALASTRDLVNQYPTMKHRTAMETVLYNIGVENIGYTTVRSVDFPQSYGFPAPAASAQPVQSATAGPSGITTPKPTVAQAIVPTSAISISSVGVKPIAVALNDPKSVIRKLKKFTPRGNNREKVVTLLQEARNLKLEKHPHSFCFLLRSMFEISAKAYCKDYAAAGLSMTKASGEDKKLIEVLKEISNHLTNNRDKNNPMTKVLHGAITELAIADGFLSVTSMNQLVHNPTFSVDETHISTLFHNVFPLLEAMNR